MNLLYIITGLGMGGAEKQTVLIANKMHEAGHNVMIISLTGDTLVKPTDGVQLNELKLEKTPFSLFKGLFKVRKIIKKFKPDIVHSHMFHANLFARLLRTFTKIPVLICTAHNTNEGSSLRMLAYKYTDKLASLSTNVSQDAVDSFIQKGASTAARMIVVSNGIDTSQFDFSMDDRKKKRSELGIFDDTPMLLSVGRLTEAKDYPNLLTAYSLLIKNNKFQSFPRLFIVGTGHLEGQLKSMSKEFGIENYVTFLGQRNDIRQLMCAADIFILSSEWEGFPLVITEAMACKKLIVATDAGGITEALGDCGSVVPVKDPARLSQEINKMINLSDEQKEILGNKVRERIKQTNSIEKIIERWMSIYTQYY
ncbi:glycosyl transferases group 1 family protein [Yersinia rochesterensis]|uniref:Glycosyl transferases group 1 family protein n=1 Tax=Yersinia rochesterensis TaxID=1604335 RepID=A0A386HG38_9GAMM|nr:MULTISPECIES: glycosyltransferase [Yersinia]AJI86703.1 glycosyl transferases group 1 family protein [Yersinia frederiksenii Y225]CNG87675.1 WbcN protein [Yersinia kristensenii]AIN19916.1 glycosyl transferases group 1 family protein [Yersinia rochesterensis]AJJ34188.1 glycosyl transferases group 1 family protein [Yersinia rochesterensis]AYD44802.1 glycosyltransferase [Yersinia rochesterensis]